MKGLKKKYIVWSCMLILLMGITGCGNSSDEIVLSSVEELDTGAQKNLTEEMDTNDDDSVETTTITVYVCGAVITPGVYDFEIAQRVTHALEKAGGFTSDADTQYWNLAQILTDGEKIYVPTKEEVKNGYAQSSNSIGSSADGSGKININTATKEQLMALTGVGEAKALSIISYRENNGNYKAIEDVMKISGIKDAVFNTIKDYITV